MKPKRYLIPVFIPHLGCPNDCVFCNQRKISGETQPATSKTVRRAIESALTKMPSDVPAELAFYGGSFTAIPVSEQIEFLEAAQEFLCLNRENTLRLSTRPDCIDEETLLRLKKYGVRTIELGAQSMCMDVLRKSRRGHTAQDVCKAAEMVKAHSFELVLQMMTGLPGDTPGKSIYTALRLVSLKPDAVRIYPTVIVRDTTLSDMWHCGGYAEHTVEDAVELCARLVPIFECADVPVIRLGLNPSDELSDGAAEGGAYHPAFGELVYSKIYLDRVRALLRDVKEGSSILITVPRGKVSVMTGQKRANIIALMSEFGLKIVKIRESETENGQTELLSVDISHAV